MTGIVIQPGLFGSVCAFAVMLWALFGVDRWLSRQELERRREARRQDRHKHIPDSEIDHTYVSGGE